MKFKEITLMGIAVRSFSLDYGKVPNSVNIENRKYNKNYCLYILAKSVVKMGRDVDFVSFASAPTPYTGSFEKNLTKSEYTDIANRVAKYIDKNKRVPNFVSYKDEKISMDLCLFAFAKIVVWYHEHKAMPNTCLFEKPKKKGSSASKGGKLTKAIQEKTGVTINDYKSLYKAFSRAVYKYYYDDQKDQKSALSQLRQGLNCVDMNQLAYYSLKEMGYDVQIVRGTINCTDGVFGHVWCRLKVGGKWINFDASASARGKGLGSVICGSVISVTNINPGWAVSDDGRT